MGRVNTQQYLAAGAVFVGGGTLSLISGFNPTANLRYLQLFDKATAATAGNVPVQSLLVPAQSNFSFAPSAQGYPYRTGLVWGVSSTPNTFTAAADLFWVAAEAQSQ